MYLVVFLGVFFFPENSFLKNCSKMVVGFSYICICIIHILSCFVFFSLSSIFNMSLWLGRLCKHFPRLRHYINHLFIHLKKNKYNISLTYYKSLVMFVSVSVFCLLFFRDMSKNVQVFLMLGNLAIWHYNVMHFHIAFSCAVSQKKVATNFLDLATTSKHLGARCLLEKTKKPKKACKTKWLSFNNSVASLYEDPLAVMVTLSSLPESDAMAYGLLKNIKSGTVHSVLPHLAYL